MWTYPGVIMSLLSQLNTLGLQLDIIVRIVIAVLLGAVIGYERESTNQPAGLRTHMLVAGGAACFMTLSMFGFGDVISTGRIVLDPSRVAAQIVTGVGFLGAGPSGARGPACGPYHRGQHLGGGRHRHGMRRGAVHRRRRLHYPGRGNLALPAWPRQTARTPLWRAIARARTGT